MEIDPLDDSTRQQLSEEQARLLNQLNENVKLRRALEISHILGAQHLLLSTEKVAKQQISEDRSIWTATPGGQTDVSGSK
jgi:hypothetical protein